MIELTKVVSPTRTKKIWVNPIYILSFEIDSRASSKTRVKMAKGEQSFYIVNETPEDIMRQIE